MSDWSWSQLSSWMYRKQTLTRTISIRWEADRYIHGKEKRKLFRQVCKHKFAKLTWKGYSARTINVVHVSIQMRTADGKRTSHITNAMCPSSHYQFSRGFDNILVKIGSNGIETYLWMVLSIASKLIGFQWMNDCVLCLCMLPVVLWMHNKL